MTFLLPKASLLASCSLFASSFHPVLLTVLCKYFLPQRHRHPHPTAQVLSSSQAGPTVLVPAPTHPPSPTSKETGRGAQEPPPRFCWVSFSSGLTLPGKEERKERGRGEGEEREAGRERRRERAHSPLDVGLQEPLMGSQYPPARRSLPRQRFPAPPVPSLLRQPSPQPLGSLPPANPTFTLLSEVVRGWG